MSRQSTKDFEGSETIRYDSTVGDTCHYTFVKTHRMYISDSEAYYKLWTLGDNGVNVGSLIVTNQTRWLTSIVRAVVCVERRQMRILSTLCFRFCYESKSAQQIKFMKQSQS